MLAKYGITLPEFAEFIDIALAGEVVSQVYENGKSFDLTVKVRDNERDEIEKIANLMIERKRNRKIPLSYISRYSFFIGTEHDQQRKRKT